MVHTSSHCCEKSIYSPNFIQISHCCNKITRHFLIVNSDGLKRQLLVLVFMKWEEEKTMFLFKFSPLGAVHKLCRLKGEGKVKNCQFNLVKRQLRGGGGQKITDFEKT